MTSIQRLSSTTQASLQASLVAVKLDDICRVLVRHALQDLEQSAQSKKTIWITMDYETWSMSVKHNADIPANLRQHGRSMVFQESDVHMEDTRLLSYLGMLHTRYCSKEIDVTHLLRDGETLFGGPTPSLAQSNAIEEEWTTSTLHSRLLEDGRGAVLCLREIFHNLPVRRSFLVSESHRRKQNELLTECLKQLSLLCPQVSIRLLVHPAASRSGGAEPKTLLALSSALNLLERFKQNYSADSLDGKQMRRIQNETWLVMKSTTQTTSSHTKSIRMRVEGFVSLTTSSTAPQLLFVNGRSWPRALPASNALQESNNEESAFGRMLDLFGISWCVSESSTRRSRGGLGPDFYDTVHRRIDHLLGAVPTTKSSRHAFILVIKLERLECQARPSASPLRCDASTFRSVVLDSICDSYHRNHAAAQPVLPSSANTSREAQGKRALLESSIDARNISKRPKTAPDDTLYNRDRLASVRRPQTAALASSMHTGNEASLRDGMVAWRDPRTGQLFHIDPRTGQSFGPVNQSSRGFSSNSDHTPDRLRRAGPASGTLFSKRPGDKNGIAGTQGDTVPTWLKDTLEGWQNPAFAQVQGQNPDVSESDSDVDNIDTDDTVASLPSTPRRSNRLSSAPHRNSRFFGTRADSISQDPTQIVVGVVPTDLGQHAKITETELPISRADLAKSMVLGQVDDKFILCSLSSGAGNPMLVCIDQHAADERCRLERLLQDYIESCQKSQRTAVSPDSVVTLSISRQEHDLLRRQAEESATRLQDTLRFFGFEWTQVVMVHEQLGHAQVDLCRFPEILEDRVRSAAGRIQDLGLLTSVFKRTMQELVKRPLPESLLAEIASESRTSGWLTFSRWIPPSLMDVLLSKACRSAIMFGDPLSKEACRRLVARLAECHFPFQCAHGRPSMVPLCRY